MTLLLLDFIRNRKVLLIVDNCPAHPEIGGLKATELCFLPPKTTSITQPMEQGVKPKATKSQVPLPHNSTNRQSS